VSAADLYKGGKEEEARWKPSATEENRP
jgi:hypothetical protein